MTEHLRPRHGNCVPETDALTYNAIKASVAMAENNTSADAPTAPQKPPRRKPRQTASPPKVKRLPRWNVVLLDDNQHTYEYVIDMLGRIFGFDSVRGYRLAREVDGTGRAIVYTAHRELAELKCQQIKAFGADPRLSSSRASMQATIEQAD